MCIVVSHKIANNSILNYVYAKKTMDIVSGINLVRKVRLSVHHSQCTWVYASHDAGIVLFFLSVDGPLQGARPSEKKFRL